MMAARIADRMVGVVSTVILARLLVPADFGLVAMAMAVISLIELANSFGFEIPLIRATNPGRDQYDTVWTLNLSFGVFCSLAIALAAFPAAAFYNDERLTAVMLYLAAAWLVGSTANVGVVDFRRNLDFAKEFRYLMVARVAAFVVTIPCALYFRSYWALIAGMLVKSLATTALSYLWHPYRPRPCLRAIRELFAFSVWIFVEKVANFGNARAADFLLGRLHGPAAVGMYRMGEEIGYLPGTELIAPINRALLPGAFRMAEGGRRFSDITIKSVGVVVLLLAPACLGICAVAEPIVQAMLGDKWLEVVPILRVMAVNALMIAIWNNQHTILFAAGFPRLPGLVGLIRFAVLLPLALALVPGEGPLGVAWAVLASAGISVVIGMHLALRRLEVPRMEYLRAIWRPLVAALVMYVIVDHLVATLSRPGELPSYVTLLLGVLAGMLSFAAVLLVLYVVAGRPPGAERTLLDYLASAWARRKAGNHAAGGARTTADDT